MLPSITALLTAIADYAGLFPPAQLDLRQAMANYVQYSSLPERWLLGRFVLPASRLDEFQLLLPEFPLAQWSLSVIVGQAVEQAIAQIQSYLHHPQIAIQSLEFVPLDIKAIAQVLPLLPDGVEVFFEVPWNSSLDAYLRVLQSTSAAIKLRTGGITADAFPNRVQLGQAILQCVEAQVPFKATAGLHHPLPATHPLTDESDRATTTMHGFLNVALLAAFALQQPVSLHEAVAVLETSDSQSITEDDSTIKAVFQFGSKQVVWGDRTLSLPELETARQRGFRSFGSCSFTEPITDLKAWQLID
jgi:hypothetical protein